MRGGFRAGAGRPRGSKTARLPTSVAPEAQGGRLTPLDYLLSLVSDPAQTTEVRMRAAALVLPYCHPKPPAMSAKDLREAEARTAHLKTEWEELLS